MYDIIKLSMPLKTRNDLSDLSTFSNIRIHINERTHVIDCFALPDDIDDELQLFTSVNQRTGSISFIAKSLDRLTDNAIDILLADDIICQVMHDGIVTYKINDHIIIQ